MKNLIVIIFLLVASSALSCGDRLVSSAGTAPALEDFEAAWSRVDSVYPYLQFKKIDWDSVYTVYRPRFETSRGDEFFHTFRDLLGELKDGHVWFQTEHGSRVYPYVSPRHFRDRKAYCPFVVRSYFDRPLRISKSTSVEYEITPENIGYAYMPTFEESYLQNEFPGVLAYLKNTTGLILDLRANRGGNRHNIDAVVSRFVTEPLKRFDVYRLGELLEPSFIQPQGPFTYTQSVVVLINGRTYSAGEYCAEVLKSLPNVTVVGDTTGGGSTGSAEGDPEAAGTYRLPSGKKIYVGTFDMRRYDGVPWEGLGIAPDIRVMQTVEDVNAGRDKQLEFAIGMLVE